MIYSLPDGTVEIYADGFDAGLEGTLGVGIQDAAGEYVVARATDGISEITPIPGKPVYAATVTAPAAAGVYLIVWDDGTTIATEELTVTTSATVPIAPTGPDAAVDRLVARLATWIGHPTPAVDSTPFTRSDFEDFLSDARVDAVRFALDYTLAANMAGATSVWTPLRWWADDFVLQNYNWQDVTADRSDPMNGRWDFDSPHIYPIYLTGRTYDLHRVAADMLEAWAAKVKLEHDLGIGDLSLTRSQKAATLREMADDHRRQMRAGSVRIVDDSVMTIPGAGKAWRQATQPPPM